MTGEALLDEMIISNVWNYVLIHSICLACRGFYKPVLAQHDQCCIKYFNDIMCIYFSYLFLNIYVLVKS